jgi:outer membrane protein assembly factor BamA
VNLLQRVALAVLLLWAGSVFGQSEFVIGTVGFEGNKVTKDKILFREMTIKEGDVVRADSIAYHLHRCRSNLRNIKLFNFIEIDTCVTDGNVLEVVVRLVERWYVWPVPLIELADRNFGEWWQTKDFGRIDFGTFIFWNNFRGRNETVVMELRFGYNNRYQLRYEIPYLNKKQTIGIEFKGGYEQAREVNFGAIDNRRAFISDGNRVMRRMAYGAVTPIWRPNLYTTHEVEVAFTNGWVADTIASLNPNFFGNGEHVTNHFSLQYMLVHDYTDYTIYPLKGHILSLKARKDGFGLLGSSVDLFSAEVEFSKYWKLHPRWYFAHGQKLKVSSFNTQPYIYQRGLGYMNDYVRGYELNVIDGQHFALVKTSLRWMLLQPKRINLKFLKTDKLGLIPITIFANANFDAGFVMDNQLRELNPLAEQWLYGGGVGIDVSTFYDILWRFEYSVNKVGRHGFFLHFQKHI